MKANRFSGYFSLLKLTRMNFKVNTNYTEWQGAFLLVQMSYLLCTWGSIRLIKPTGRWYTSVNSGNWSYQGWNRFSPVSVSVIGCAHLKYKCIRAELCRADDEGIKNANTWLCGDRNHMNQLSNIRALSFLNERTRYKLEEIVLKEK